MQIDITWPQKNAKKQHWVRHKRRLTRSLTFTSLSLFRRRPTFRIDLHQTANQPGTKGWRRIYFCKFSVPQRAVASHSLPIRIYMCAVGLTGGSVGEWSACYSTRAYTSSSSVCVRVHILSRSSQSAVNNSEFNYWASGGGVFGCANHPRRALRHLHAARFNLLYAP
jgi:hypothetical protein